MGYLCKPPFRRIVANKFSTMSWLSRDVNRNLMSSFVRRSSHNCDKQDIARRQPLMKRIFFAPITFKLFRMGIHVSVKIFICSEFFDRGRFSFFGSLKKSAIERVEQAVDVLYKFCSVYSFSCKFSQSCICVYSCRHSMTEYLSSLVNSHF